MGHSPGVTLQKVPRPGRGARASVPKDVDRIVQLVVGANARDGQGDVVIRHVVSPARVIVQDLATGVMREVTGSSLSVIPTRPPARHVAEADASPEDWTRALAWFDALRGLCDAKTRTASRVRAAAGTLGISPRHAYRLIDRISTYGTAAALLQRKPGSAAGTHRLAVGTEQLIAEHVRDALRHSADASVDDVWLPICDAAVALGLRPPGRTTVARRLAAARQRPEHLPTAVRREVKARTRCVKFAWKASFPLEVVQIDHTVVDAFVLDPEFGLPIGRPVLTLALDEATRVILGMLLSLEAPSSLSLALCLDHAVRPKQEWLTSIGLPDADWPGYGLPAVLFSDNGAEFITPSFQAGCSRYDIRPRLRPKGKPEAGGLIERAIGTFMTKVRLIPGSSFSKLLGKPTRHVHKSARFSITDLTEYLAREISRYHKTRHAGLGMAPLAAWERAAFLPRMPADLDQFRINFLPGKPRTVTRHGVRMFNQFYGSDAVYDLEQRGARRFARWDPRDISWLYIDAGDRYLVAENKDPLFPACSVWEWNEIEAERRRRGAPYLPGKISAEIRANRELIRVRAARSTRQRDTRRLARELEWSRIHRPAPADAPPAAPLRVAPQCRITRR